MFQPPFGYTSIEALIAQEEIDNKKFRLEQLREAAIVNMEIENFNAQQCPNCTTKTMHTEETWTKYHPLNRTGFAVDHGMKKETNNG